MPSPAPITASAAPAGCARRCSAPTTASSPPPASIVGVAASRAGRAAILTAAGAGWAAGAMAMAAGEYVSVSSQADSKAADLDREQHALEHFPEIETDELTVIYERRGLAPALARQVAEQLMATDALSAHARDELGLGERAAPMRCSPPPPRRSASRRARRCRPWSPFSSHWRRPSPPCQRRRSPFSPRSARSAPGSAARRRSSRRCASHSGARWRWR